MFQIGPIHYLRAIGGGFGAGVGGGIALRLLQELVPIFGMLSLMFLAALGYGVGTAVAVATGRKQGTALGVIAALMVPLGVALARALLFIVNGANPTLAIVAGFALLFGSTWNLLGLLVAMAIAFSRAR
jgi:hypothetical protein